MSTSDDDNDAGGGGVMYDKYLGSSAGLGVLSVCFTESMGFFALLIDFGTNKRGVGGTLQLLATTNVLEAVNSLSLSNLDTGAFSLFSLSTFYFF